MPPQAPMLMAPQQMVRPRPCHWRASLKRTWLHACPMPQATPRAALAMLPNTAGPAAAADTHRGLHEIRQVPQLRALSLQHHMQTLAGKECAACDHPGSGDAAAGRSTSPREAVPSPAGPSCFHACTMSGSCRYDVRCPDFVRKAPYGRNSPGSHV